MILGDIEGFVPPRLWQLLRGRLGNRFEGDFSSWAEAQRACTGYDDTAIVERVARAVREVEANRAAAERDGVLLDQIDYSWPMLTCLLLVASVRGGALNVVDFGGSLGTSYRQNRKFLDSLPNLHWAIVEQPSFVALGRREFQDERLRFFGSLDDALQARAPDVVLLSGVLQYLQQPRQLLTDLVTKPVDFLLFDRTPLIDGQRDRLTIQRVPKHINPASYPAWFLSRSYFISTLEQRFELVEEFEGRDRANVPSARYFGSLWRRRHT